ncbi:hypothetical protein KC335_g16588, partial [Hortaea werneckii]
MTILGETGSRMLKFFSHCCLHDDYTSAYLIEELPPRQIKVHHPTSPDAATAGQSFTNHHCTWAALPESWRPFRRLTDALPPFNPPDHASAFELDREIQSTSSPIVTAGPDVSSEPDQSTSAPESPAQQQQHPHTHLTHSIPPEERSSGEPSNQSGRSQKRRRQSSSAPLPGSRLTGVYRSGQPEPKRARANDTNQATGRKQAEDMRLDNNSGQHEHKARTSANGSSSQNGGSSPHTNGSTKSGDTNGYHTNGHAEPNVSPFYGHDREEVTRILLQSLSDLGYGGAARQLSAESGFELEIPSVAAFRNAVQQGEWEEAEALLLGSDTEYEGGGVSLGNGHSSPSRRKSRQSFGSQNGYMRHGLPLAEGADTTTLKFLLREQKYLELLERRDANSALSVLRNELTPLKRDIGRLHALSSLMMTPSAEEMRAQAGWDGAQGSSRNFLLSEISKSISPSVMIPEHRLATLFTAVQEDQILNCRYHNTTAQPSLYTDHECSPDDFPLHNLTELRNHTDEVWHLDFSHDGSLL